MAFFVNTAARAAKTADDAADERDDENSHCRNDDVR